jgi:hypothetical protein
MQQMQRQLETMRAQELGLLLTDDDQLQSFAATWVAGGEVRCCLKSWFET